MSFPVAKPIKFASLLDSAGINAQPASFAKDEVIFSKGDRNDSLFYIKSGSVKLTASCKDGREAIIGLLDGGSLFGESCITATQPVRSHDAITVTETEAARIPRASMVHLLRSVDDASYMFITYLLDGMARMQTDLASSLVHTGEQRLARLLVSLSQFRSKNRLEFTVNQQTIAEMIGTTRQRVNLLMTSFRRLGYIEDAAGHKIHKTMRRIAPDD